MISPLDGCSDLSPGGLEVIRDFFSITKLGCLAVVSDSSAESQEESNLAFISKSQGSSSRHLKSLYVQFRIWIFFKNSGRVNGRLQFV